MNIEEIKEGWLNYIRNRINKRNLSHDFRNEIESRSSICYSCPELTMRQMKILKAAVGKCNKCGCAFPAMIFSARKKCPIGKWDSFTEKD